MCRPSWQLCRSELDPEAYKKSSPIEYADQLRGHLLIELKKDNWKLARYRSQRLRCPMCAEAARE
jgi:hypothetical protein